MDAKTRRVLKAKQSQQGALDTSIATVANKKANENVLTPKIWTTRAKTLTSGSAIAFVPGFIPLDNILTIEFVIEYATATERYKAFVSFNDHTGHALRPVVKLSDRGIYTGAMGTAIQNRDVRITIFYI